MREDVDGAGAGDLGCESTGDFGGECAGDLGRDGTRAEGRADGVGDVTRVCPRMMTGSAAELASDLAPAERTEPEALDRPGKRVKILIRRIIGKTYVR